MADKVHFLVQKFNLFSLVVFATVLKVLLIPTYRSTDFEVHRNWLAITHSLPLSQWYFEKTSEWTLDYPPLFAWFEYLLSQVAVFVDPGIVRVNNLNYASLATILFQRGSVMVSDLMLVIATKEYFHYRTKNSKEMERAMTFIALIIFNFGLLLVDHIHFQYNGFLFGMLLLSLTRMMEGYRLESAFWFAVLLNFKHIFLYMAPAYFVFLLREYCFVQSDKAPPRLLGVNVTDFSPLRLIRLGFIVVSVFLLSFGPFLYMGQIAQVLSRLFPFKRGLCHAYWAPNIWSLYNVADKALLYLGIHTGSIPRDILANSSSTTSGLVGQVNHIILPSVPPLATLVLTVVSILPSLWTLWFHPSGCMGFLRSLILCAFCSFLFGWHVHEKAIIMVIIPLSLLAVENKEDARVFLLLACSGHFSLFPLIFTSQEYVIKLGLMLVYTRFSFSSLDHLFSCASPVKSWNLPLLSWYESFYLLGMIFLEIYCEFVHWFLGLQTRLPFLPLLLRSVYCTVGVLWSWLLFYGRTLPFKSPASKNMKPVTMRPVNVRKSKKS